MRILLVEDDALLASGLADALRGSGFSLDHHSCGEPALDTLRHEMHDLLILDIGLPGKDGLLVLKAIRQAGLTLPVLMLTARDGLWDRVTGLNEGADDYLTKPFLLPELLARVHALIRRSRSAVSSRLLIGPLHMDLASHEARLGEEALALTGREWSLLEALALAAPQVVAKRRLADSLGRWDKEITENAIEIYVSRLRSKLAGHGLKLRTIRGVGYRLEAALI